MIVASVREQCARVAASARQVRIVEQKIPHYAASLALAPGFADASAPPLAPGFAGARALPSAEREALAARWLTLDAINFGSGWFPTLRKLPGRTGYATIAEGISRQFDRRGPWTALELSTIDRETLAEVLDQDPKHELIGLFMSSLRDLGSHVSCEHGGSFGAVLDAASGSAVRLVEMLAGWEAFADSSSYAGEPVPFLKRAQIAAADVHRSGAQRFSDLPELTMFADNLVPHVLRLDGILTFEAVLVGRIERGELIEHGSPEEVEIRACAVHAVELIVRASPTPTTAVAVDQLLWHRGQRPAYKAVPRHRSRCTAY